MDVSSKMSAYNAGDLGSIPGSGRSPGEGNGNPLQYSCLENLMDGGAYGGTKAGTSNTHVAGWEPGGSGGRLQSPASRRALATR